MSRISKTEWELELFPDHRFLMEPARGRTYRSMANRYVNCRKEPPVSQTIRRAVEFSFDLHPLRSCRSVDGMEMEVKEGRVRIFPGRYRLGVTA